MKKKWTGIFALVVLAATRLACNGGGDSSDGSTSWLEPCDVTTDCDSQYTCVCGVCTQLCTAGAECGSLPRRAVCVDPSQGLESACRFGLGTSGAGPACFPPCGSDDECPDRLACVAGLCAPTGSGVPKDGGVPSADASASADASRPGPGASDAGGGSDSAGPRGDPTARPPGRPNPQDFADVSIPGNFEQPVALPPPDRAITGDASALLGSWVELNDEGGPCGTGSVRGTGWCTHLDLERDAAGGFVGTLSREPSPTNPPGVAGPFAPPTDPSVGYPVELSPAEYGALRDFSANVRYRLLDGTMRGDTLSFFVAPLDLWNDWCAMQTPFVWDLGERREYRCVPQSATEADTDLGKLGLCTSADDLEHCTDDLDGVVPCVCLDDEGQFNSALAQCSLAYCECSQTECRADTRGTSISGSFRLDGDRLVGAIAFDGFFRYSIEMGRVTP